MGRKMKEIKAFVDMMESHYEIWRVKLDDDSGSESALDIFKGDVITDALLEIQETKEYKTLKSLANASVAKVEVTDEILKIAGKAFRDTAKMGSYNKSIKVMLEAVFNHIDGSNEKVENTCYLCTERKPTCYCVPKNRSKSEPEKEPVSELKQSTSKYTTVEGNPIHSHMLFSTRNGHMAHVYFCGEKSIEGMIHDSPIIIRDKIKWNLNGTAENKDDDLMGPWTLEKESVFYNFPPESPLLDEKELISDGWIEWKGGLRPVDILTIVEIRNAGGYSVPRGNAGSFSWFWNCAGSDIIAYRIISEPEEEVCRCFDYEGSNFKCPLCKPEEKKEPKKQALIEYLDEWFEGTTYKHKADVPAYEWFVVASSYLEKNKVDK